MCFILCIVVASLSIFEITYVFFFEQKTAYDMRISDWSSDVCSSDLAVADRRYQPDLCGAVQTEQFGAVEAAVDVADGDQVDVRMGAVELSRLLLQRRADFLIRSEEHTSELQSLMRISYAVFCLKKKKKKT